MSSRSVLFSVLFTIFIDLIGFGVLIPVIPQLLANPASSFYLLPASVSAEKGYILLGLLLAMYPIGQFFATPILGELSDYYGRKKVLAFSLFGTAVSYVLFAIGILTKNIPLLFLSRALDGLTGGNIAVAQAAIADVSTKEDRAKNFGLMGAAFGLGFICGPFIGGLLSDPKIYSSFDAATPFFFAAVLAFCNMMLVLFHLPETNTHLSPKMHVILLRSVHNIKKAMNLDGMKAVFATGFLFQAGFTFFTTFFSVYLVTKFGFSQSGVGNYFAYVGLWIVIAQAFVTPRVSKAFKEYQVLRFSLFGMGVFMLLQYLPTVWWVLLFITPFFATANGLTMAMSGSLVSKSAPKEMQGEVLGVNASVAALAQSIPPILSGFIAASMSPNAPLLISSVVIFIAWAVFVVSYKPASK